MSAAVAAISPAPLPAMDRRSSPRSYTALAPASNSLSDRLSHPNQQHESSHSVSSYNHSPPDSGRSPRAYVNGAHDSSTAMSSLNTRNAANPKIMVKKEPPSSPPATTNARHRPRKLDLNTTTNIPGPLSSRLPVSATMHDVGLACLSPGFQTHDPNMREQLQRSISVRDQQRSIIESRLLKSAKGDHPDSGRTLDDTNSFGRAPLPPSKKRPPPGLSIVPPSAERFANERVIQSAPLGQTFTGRNNGHPAMREYPPPPPSGHTNQGPSQVIPAMQTQNRLPPISDVLRHDSLSRPQFLHTNSTPAQSHGPPLPSPGFPPQTAHPLSYPSHPPFERPREYRSAEEAVQEMTGGREDLQPKIIRYSNRQPPTPPSPPHRNDYPTPHKFAPPQSQSDSGAGRRRTRNEYEADSSPPLGNGLEALRRVAPFGSGRDRDSPATQAAKKEEFMSLVSRAWDLFHS